MTRNAKAFIYGLTRTPQYAPDRS